MGGPAGGAPRTPKKFRKFEQIFFKKWQKCIIFAYFTQNFTNPALIFRAFGRKTQIVGNFDKIFKNFLKKIAKNALFLPILHKTLQTLR